MPDVSGSGPSFPSAQRHLPATTALEGESAAAGQVGWEFIVLYTLAFISTSLLFLASAGSSSCSSRSG